MATNAFFQQLTSAPEHWQQPIVWVQALGYVSAALLIITGIIILSMNGPNNALGWVLLIFGLAFLGILIWFNATHGWVNEISVTA